MRVRGLRRTSIWIRSTKENTLALAKALREFGFPVSDEQAQKLAEGRNMMRLGAKPNQVDLLGFLGSRGDPLDFDAVFDRTVHADLLGVDVLFLSKEDFVRSQVSANRPKDRSDLAELAEEVEPCEPSSSQEP